MEALNDSATCQPSSVGRLYEELAALINQLPQDRQHDIQELLNMADIHEQLLKAIECDGRTHYRLAIDSGVNAEVIARFASGDRDIRLATAAKLAEALGLQLVNTKKPNKK